MSPTALAFGANFETAFQKKTQGGSAGEVRLFRAMQASLVEAADGTTGIAAEEYHGTKHQVSFTGAGGYSRLKARCELADLMVVAFDKARGHVRLSYFQAKSERTNKLPFTAGLPLAANLEQWDLLSRRPAISGIGKFDPPADLLTSAIMSSVGSFAFFLSDAGGNFDVYYASASALLMAGAYTQRYGRLGSCGPAVLGGTHCECTSMFGAAAFGAALASLLVGTPVEPASGASASVRAWLVAVLRELAREAAVKAIAKEAELAIEVATLLADDSSPPVGSHPSTFGAKALILLRIDAADREEVG